MRRSAVCCCRMTSRIVPRTTIGSRLDRTDIHTFATDQIADVDLVGSRVASAPQRKSPGPHLAAPPPRRWNPPGQISTRLCLYAARNFREGLGLQDGCCRAIEMHCAFPRIGRENRKESPPALRHDVPEVESTGLRVPRFARPLAWCPSQRNCCTWGEHVHTADSTEKLLR